MLRAQADECLETDDLADVDHSDPLRELARYEWLSQLAWLCEAGKTHARIDACVAAADLCGGRYEHPDRHWFDAVRQWHNTTEGWAREDGEFMERVNHALRAWEERIAEPEEDDEMATTALKPTQPRKRAKRPPADIPETQEQAAAKEAAVESSVQSRVSRVTDAGDGSLKTGLTFPNWRKPIVAALGWNDSQVRKHNDELHEIYCDGHTVNEACELLRLAHGKKSETGKRRQPERASTVNATSERLRDRVVLLPTVHLVLREDNPRQTIDDAALQQLAEAIKTDGLQNPLVVAPHPKIAMHYEVWQGERRLRAVRDVLKLPHVLCRIVEGAREAELVRARAQENLARADLNPIEQAESYRQMLAAGSYATQAELAKAVGLSAGEVSNRLRLLKLPEPWTSRVASGEIPPGHARFLAPWAEEEAILKSVGQRVAQARRYRGGDDPYGSQVDWQDTVRRAVMECSRPLGRGGSYVPGKGWIECKLTKTQQVETRLDVRTVPVDGKPEKRAFNVQLWDSWNGAREKERAEKRAKREESAGKKATAAEPTLTPEQKREQRKKQTAQWRKKVYRYKLGWLVRRIVEAIQSSKGVASDLAVKWLLHFACAERPPERGEQLGRFVAELGGRTKWDGAYGYGRTDVLASLTSLPVDAMPALALRCLAEWVAQPCEGGHAMIHPADIEAMAADLAIDFAAEWRVEEAFLELHTREQLAALAKEWQLSLITGTRKWMLTKLLELAQAADVRAPKALVKLKPVRL